MDESIPDDLLLEIYKAYQILGIGNTNGELGIKSSLKNRIKGIINNPDFEATINRLTSGRFGEKPDEPIATLRPETRADLAQPLGAPPTEEPSPEAIRERMLRRRLLREARQAANPQTPPPSITPKPTTDSTRKIPDNITIEGNLTPKKQKYLDDILSLPPHIQEKVRAHGVQVTIGDGGVGDNFPEWDGVQVTGHKPGVTWNDVPGAYIAKTKQLYLGSGSTSSGNLARHEYGHAADQAYGILSSKKEFIDMHNTTQFKFAYFNNKDRRGRAEAFAELFSMIGFDDAKRAAAIKRMTANPAEAAKAEALFQWILFNLNK